MQDFCQKILQEHNVKVEIEPHDIGLLRAAPAAVYVSNHVYNGLDELILLRVLAEKKVGESPDPRVISPYANDFPKQIKAYIIKQKKKRIGDKWVREELQKIIAEAVKNGVSLGLSIDFAGVPLAGWPLENMERAVLRRQLFRALRKSNVPVLPVRLKVDSPIEVFLKSWLPPMPLPKLGPPVRVSVRIGKPISAATIQDFERNKQWRAFLRAKIYSLGSALEVLPFFFFRKKEPRLVPIAEAVNPVLLKNEVDALQPENRLASRANFDVLVAQSHQIPNILQELGRLRETAFRAVEEGTGEPLDLDEFDLYYQQLFIWDREAHKIAGGYRIGDGDRIFETRGPSGFYTSTVFKFKEGFFEILKNGAELGRSFVSPDYQKHRLPLFLLWKGILHFLEARPHLKLLFGPVSISKSYTQVSKSVIVEFIRKNCFDEKLAAEVDPRKEFRFRSQNVDSKILADQLPNIEALERFIADIEPKHDASPVLLKQYIKQNAQFVGFNVDPNFSNCLDGLMYLNLKDLPSSTLENLKQEA